MKYSVIDRREALKLIGAAGLMAIAGLPACYAARPTRIAETKKQGFPKTYVLGNVQLVDVKAGKVLRDQSVLIRNGTIDKVGPVKEISDPALPLVPGADYYLVPGFINAHCHLNSVSISNFGPLQLETLRNQMILNYEDSIAWGITSARDMGSAPAFMLKDRERINRGAIPGPHILTALSFLGVRGGYPDFLDNMSDAFKNMTGGPFIYTTNANDAADGVKRLKDKGADLIKIAFDHKSVMYRRGSLNVLSDAQVEAIVNEAAKQSLPVAAHHQFLPGLKKGKRFRITTMEHLVTDEPLGDKMIQEVADCKLAHVPTLTSRLNLSYPNDDDPLLQDRFLQEVLLWRDENLVDEMRHHSLPAIYDRCLEMKDFYLSGKYKTVKKKMPRSFNPPHFAKGMVFGTRNLNKMIQAGVPIGAGNDSGVPFTFPGMFHYELQLLKMAGMTDTQALQSATMVNAQICGIDHLCGTIESGKRADMVLLGDNPLEDIANTAKVKMVFKAGTLEAQT